MARTFDPTAPPTPAELKAAKQLVIKDEEGQDVTLGSLIDGDLPVIAIWIRHFYCGLCQDFISFLGSKVTPEQLAGKAKLIIIGCGDPSMIKGYRDLLKTPFPIYADPTKKTYVALGMTLRSLDQGKFDKPPEYLIRSMLAGIFGSIKSAFSIGKIGASSGDIKQLGGEFVFGPDDSVLLTHRMENTRGHSPVATLLDAAGVPHNEI